MARPQAFDTSDLAVAGLDLVADVGWAAISVRSVADRLRVSPMALYRVAPDAQHLRRIIADAAAEPIQPQTDSGDLLETLDIWARRAYRHLGRYPGLAGYVITEWTELPHWLDIVEALLAQATADAMVGPRAVATMNAIYTYVLLRCQVRDTAAAAPRRRLAPVREQRSRYPQIRANLGEFTTAKTDKHFSIGLDAFIRGLRTDVGTKAR